MSLLSTASSSRGFRLVMITGASAVALLVSACSSTKDEQFAASAPQPGYTPYAVPPQAYPYPNQAYAPQQPYPNQQAYAPAPARYPNQQPFATSSWAQPPAYGQPYPPQPGAPMAYSYSAPQPIAAPAEKESYRDEYMRKRNQQK